MSNAKDIITISDSPISPQTSKRIKKNNDKDLIMISDSPATPRSNKRKYEAESTDLSPAPKHPLLQSVSNRFEHNRHEREAKVAEFHAKRDAEKVHSEYLKKYESSPRELARAGFAAGHWAKKNGMKVEMPRRAQSLVPPRRKPSKKSKVTRNESSEYTSAVATDIPPIIRFPSETDFNNAETSSEESVSQCPILYCDIHFTSVAKLQHHMNLFEHSPCNPCRLIIDGKLKPDPQCYKCPLCDLEFSSFANCKDHMKAENHLSFMPPLSITAFMCAQCLHLFDIFENCLKHIEESKHFSVCLPFEDDTNDSEFCLPVPVGEEFMQGFVSKCQEIRYEVRCMQCDLVPENPRAVREHQKETCNLHIFSAFTEGSITDIISHYLAPYNCNVCQRLFHEKDTPNGLHDCYHGITGSLKEGTASTFAEFIKRCSLTLRESYKDPEVVCIDDDSDVRPKKNGVQTLSDENVCDAMTDKKTTNRPTVFPASSTGGMTSKPGIVGKNPTCVQTVEMNESAISVSGNVDMYSPQTSNTTADIIQTHIANDALTSLENLKSKKNIIFLDLDNYPSFFIKLPQCPSSHTFIWVFYGGGFNINSKRVQCPMFKAMQKKGMVYVHEKCGTTKDAADFALVLTLGKLDITLPASVSFTILSADRGFCEVERQMAKSNRNAMVINQKDSDEHVLLALLTSIAEM